MAVSSLCVVSLRCAVKSMRLPAGFRPDPVQLNTDVSCQSSHPPASTLPAPPPILSHRARMAFSTAFGYPGKAVGCRPHQPFLAFLLDPRPIHPPFNTTQRSVSSSMELQEARFCSLHPALHDEDKFSYSTLRF